MDISKISGYGPVGYGQKKQTAEQEKTAVKADSLAYMFTRDHEKYVEAAKGANEIDNSAVARAKQLIASGQLESEENLRGAAENLLKFGL